MSHSHKKYKVIPSIPIFEFYFIFSKHPASPRKSSVRFDLLHLLAAYSATTRTRLLYISNSCLVDHYGTRPSGVDDHHVCHPYILIFLVTWYYDRTFKWTYCNQIVYLSGSSKPHNHPFGRIFQRARFSIDHPSSFLRYVVLYFDFSIYFYMHGLLFILS